MFVSLSVPISWSELIRRTWRDALEDDVLGLAAQLAYYFFLALFPAILFLLALGSFFPLTTLTDDIGQALGPFVSAEVLQLIQEQMVRLANNESGGLLTVGVAGALWSSSAAVVSIVAALNRAYDIEESRPWWKVRLVAIGLTIALAVFVLLALTLVLAGPALASYLARTIGLGQFFEWTWLIVQWPIALGLVAAGIAMLYYFAPDADQDWVWVTPGTILATVLWLVASLVFKFYVANFTDYTGSYGTVGAIIVVLLWFYISGVAVLMGAELSAEIEHASPYGKPPGQKTPEGRRLLGARAARAYALQAADPHPGPPPVIALPPPSRKPIPAGTGPIPALFATVAAVLTELRTLLSHTLALAKQEGAIAGKQAVTAMVGMVIALAVALAAVLVLIAANVLALIALGVPPWAAALIVGVVLGIGAGVGAFVLVTRLMTAPLDLPETRASVAATWQRLRMMR